MYCKTPKLYTIQIMKKDSQSFQRTPCKEHRFKNSDSDLKLCLQNKRFKSVMYILCYENFSRIYLLKNKHFI